MASDLWRSEVLLQGPRSGDLDGIRELGGDLYEERYDEVAIVGSGDARWATAFDNKHSSALARALGATPRQVGAGLAAVQVLPALTGAVLGIPGGLGLFAALGGRDDGVTGPPLWQLLAVVPVTVVVVAVLTTVPARIGASRPAAEILHAEIA